MKTDKPKLTERQWEVLGRIGGDGSTLLIPAAIGTACYLQESIGRFFVNRQTVSPLIRKNLVRPQNTVWPYLVYTISPAGRAALAARRAEREGSGNANRV